MFKWRLVSESNKRCGFFKAQPLLKVNIIQHKRDKMAAAWRRSLAGAADLDFWLHQEGHPSSDEANLSEVTSNIIRSVKHYKHEENWDVIHSMFFTLLLLLTVALPVCVYLSIEINTYHLCHGNQWNHHTARLDKNWPYPGNCPANTRAESFHHNLLGYYAICSSVLHYGQAMFCKQ